METYQIIVLAIFCTLVFLEILFTNFFNKHNQRPKDGVVEFVGFFQLNFLALPLVFGFGYGLAETFFPDIKGIISDWSFFAIFGLLLIFDDLTQYWWHRTVTMFLFFTTFIELIMILNIYQLEWFIEMRFYTIY